MCVCECVCVWLLCSKTPACSNTPKRNSWMSFYIKPSLKNAQLNNSLLIFLVLQKVQTKLEQPVRGASRSTSRELWAERYSIPGSPWTPPAPTSAMSCLLKEAAKKVKGPSTSSPPSAWFSVSRGWGRLCRSHPDLTCYDPLVFFFMYIFIGVPLLYSIVLVSAIQQYESAVSLPTASSLLNLPPTPHSISPLCVIPAPCWAPSIVEQLLPSCLFDTW